MAEANSSKQKSGKTSSSHKRLKPVTKGIRSVTKHIFLITNAIFAVFYIFALLSKIVPADKFVWFSYFGLIFPITLFANLAFIVFWLTRKKKIWLMSFLLIVVSVRSCNEVFTIPFSKKQVEQSEAVKLLTYNISLFGGEKNYKDITKFIFDTDADIVCLQEFGFYNRNSRLEKEDILAQFGKHYPYRHIWYKSYKGSVSWGIATFSKFPIVNKEVVEYESKTNLSIYSDIVVKGDTLRVVNNHLESNRFTTRDLKSYSSLSDNFNRQEFRQLYTTMAGKLSTAYRLRAKQARAVASVRDESPYPVVVCGDFNDVTTSYAYSTIRKDLLDVNTSTNWGYRYTYYGKGMFVNIDHVLIDPGFVPISCKIVHQKCSDHYPVVAEWAMSGKK